MYSVRSQDHGKPLPGGLVTGRITFGSSGDILFLYLRLFPWVCFLSENSFSCVVYDLCSFLYACYPSIKFT